MVIPLSIYNSFWRRGEGRNACAEDDHFSHPYPQIVKQAVPGSLTASQEEGGHGGYVADDGDEGQTAVLLFGQRQMLRALHRDEAEVAIIIMMMDVSRVRGP